MRGHRAAPASAPPPSSEAEVWGRTAPAQKEPSRPTPSGTLALAQRRPSHSRSPSSEKLERSTRRAAASRSGGPRRSDRLAPRGQDRGGRTLPTAPRQPAAAGRRKPRRRPPPSPPPRTGGANRPLPLSAPATSASRSPRVSCRRRSRLHRLLACAAVEAISPRAEVSAIELKVPPRFSRAPAGPHPPWLPRTGALGFRGVHSPGFPRRWSRREEPGRWRRGRPTTGRARSFRTAGNDRSAGATTPARPTGTDRLHRLRRQQGGAVPAKARPTPPASSIWPWRPPTPCAHWPRWPPCG